MRKTILNEVLDVLLEHRLVASESEFSRDWLGRSDSYMRGLRFHNGFAQYRSHCDLRQQVAALWGQAR